MLSITNNIKLYVAPPTTAEIGAAYVRLALGVAQEAPQLLQAYLGPPEWQEAVLTEPASLELLRTHGVAVATAIQKSDLPRNRQERLLRTVRAWLWLIRALAGEQVIFSEQVRLLLDLKPESVDEAFFQTAHDSLAAALPGSAPLAERWIEWQARQTIPAGLARPLLIEALDLLRDRLGSRGLLTTEKLTIIEADGDGPLFYQPGELHLPREGAVRVDRLYHLALQWGYGGVHSTYSALARRYQAGEVENAVFLALGPGQVIAQGLPVALLPSLDLYATAIPDLLRAAGLPAEAGDRLQVIHAAEDMLQWGLANAALLLHAENLRPRAIRRHLMTNALWPRDMADDLLEELSDPVQAAHVFAPLIGGPLIKTWLAQGEHAVSSLLADPPVPSTMVFEIRFGE
ncbi:MAG TPA: hypothetical protein VGD99_16035 [Anaerolineae bacterium]